MTRICNVCVMDDSNPMIVFDEHGQCNCCRDAYGRRDHEWWPDERGEAKMDALVALLKAEGKGRDYDVMVGLSGASTAPIWLI